MFLMYEYLKSFSFFFETYTYYYFNPFFTRFPSFYRMEKNINYEWMKSRNNHCFCIDGIIDRIFTFENKILFTKNISCKIVYTRAWNFSPKIPSFVANRRIVTIDKLRSEFIQFSPFTYSTPRHSATTIAGVTIMFFNSTKLAAN